MKASTLQTTGRFAAPIFLLLFSTLGLCQTISLTTKTGPPTTTTLVSGSGFTANGTVGISFDTTHLRTTHTDASGAFSKVTIQVPSSALPGKHRVTAGVPSGSLAQASFLVRTNWSQFQFSGNHAGFNPYENVLSPSTAPGLKLRWSYTLGSRLQSWSSPVVDNGVVYWGTDDWNLNAFDTSTGALLWKYTTGSIVESTPAVAGGVVYAGSDDNSVYALDAKTGTLKWRFQTQGHVRMSPTVVQGVVHVPSEDGYLYALDASSGTLIWKYFAQAGFSSPAVANGVVYVGNSNSNTLYALNASTGALRWKNHLGTSVGYAVVSSGTVYVQGGFSFYALDAETGVQRWTYPLASLSAGVPTTVANGVLYVPNGARLYALQADTGTLLWQYLLVATISPPAMANGVLFFGTYDDAVYAMDATAGELLWAFRTGWIVNSALAVADGVLYVYSNDGTLYAFN